jgi:muramoyltetrapeptide carboxypeptidase
MLIPPPVRPGDRVWVVAPSGPFPEAEFQAGLDWLSSHYSVMFDPSIRSRDGFLAGDDQRRLSEHERAFGDTDARAIVMARGGHGLIRILPEINLDPLRRTPKWLVGYSDITLLHLAANRAGLASIHGDNLTGLGRATDATRSAWQQSLHTAGRPRRFENLQTWSPGNTRGPLVGGNLTLLFVAAASGQLHLPKGAVLLLEDVTESPYRVDRMLSALKIGGHFENVAAVVVGDMTDCTGPQHHPTVWEVLEQQLVGLGVPVLAGLPVGHGDPNHSVTLGLTAELDADRGVLATGLAGPS